MWGGGGGLRAEPHIAGGVSPALGKRECSQLRSRLRAHECDVTESRHGVTAGVSLSRLVIGNAAPVLTPSRRGNDTSSVPTSLRSCCSQEVAELSVWCQQNGKSV